MFKFALSIIGIAGAVSPDDFCPQNAHSVDVSSFPYAKGDLHPCQYAGFLTVNEEKNHNLFYWLFKNPNATAPLVLWLNGGPGASSMFALFLENGPLRVTFSDDWELSAPDKAWTDDYHVIYVDQPVGTGFSYGDTYLTDMNVGAAEFVTFLVSFY